MAPIPLTLVGILPGHWLFGAFFTATSMIGFIAGAGIVVRNSIILVDFVELRLAQGMALIDADTDLPTLAAVLDDAVRYLDINRRIELGDEVERFVPRGLLKHPVLSHQRFGESFRALHEFMHIPAFDAKLSFGYHMLSTRDNSMNIFLVIH